MGKKYISIVMFVIVALYLIRAIKGENEYPTLSQASNPSLLNSAGLLQAMLKQQLAGLRQGPNPNKLGPPKQYVGIPAGLDEFLKMQKVGSDTYYEPFWFQGEWVFQRPTFTPRPPRYLALYPDLEKDILEQCTEFCPRIYEGYGTVCTHFVSMANGLYKIKQFQNLCHMEFDSCVQARKHHYGNYDDPWRPMFQGSCNYRWKKMVHDERRVVSNTYQYLKDLQKEEETPYNNILQQAPG